MSTEEQQQQQQQRNGELEKERLYRTKLIQFLGRTTPIILQNDNGPCPLLAICNVLLLRNNLNLSESDTSSEVSLQKLLSLVAERLIDSNSNIEDKDVGFVQNQEQNIGDAIDLLPRLATGIDVNVQFDRIDHFEYTRECAIFDLLDIPLYHGWIVDPQDTLTANVIGSKSYNTLTGELVALETKNAERIHKSNSEEDCIDFAAATTATLGVPSPCLSRAMSFVESPQSASDHQISRKGDLEEEAELLRALKLSSAEDPPSVEEPCSAETDGKSLSVYSHESPLQACSEKGVLADKSEGHLGGQATIHQSERPDDSEASSSCQNVVMSSPRESDRSLSENSAGSHLSSSKESEEHIVSSDLIEQISKNAITPNQNEPLPSPEGVFSFSHEEQLHWPVGDQQVQDTCQHDTSTSPVHLEPDNIQNSNDTAGVLGTPSTPVDSVLNGDTSSPRGDTSSPGGSEPMYEGEDHILDSGVASFENREPMYEGEIMLAEQAERGTGNGCAEPSIVVTQQNGEVIRNFLRSNASQLTVYGLFCLQEGLKERELCVFFRNNHFSTMFKFNGELYLLATDQGYINQPDLVWEKLNEVNGDTVFMTGNFTGFKVDTSVNDSWDEQNAMTNTADYLASIDNPVSSTMNSDLQLAIALQQQEFENQPQRPQNTPKPSSVGSSRLVTGPQVPPKSSSSHSSSPKQDGKNKDKCTVM